jgi:hypothetical protein
MVRQAWRAATPTMGMSGDLQVTSVAQPFGLVAVEHGRPTATRQPARSATGGPVGLESGSEVRLTSLYSYAKLLIAALAFFRSLTANGEVLHRSVNSEGETNAAAQLFHCLGPRSALRGTVPRSVPGVGRALALPPAGRPCSSCAGLRARAVPQPIRTCRRRAICRRARLRPNGGHFRALFARRRHHPVRSRPGAALPPPSPMTL